MTKTFKFDIEDLDKYNYRSEIRRLSREYRENEIKDSRRIHEYIAHYASLLVEDHIATDCRVGTTLHNEAVIITRPSVRGAFWKQGYTLQLRKDLTYTPTDHKRVYSNDFRDYMARYICEVAEKACEIADKIHLENAIQAEEQAIEAGL